ncbi:37S ribosomal protein S25,mitochondrial [Paramicrosporidium saccamoebae]|uniref:Small ribosomal subunit protein mS23 n=1 Tax=Paramicrosporidium saccamoebae TaxID=1246581 RepID=A0A2H9TLD4_9FUNG|nr:37S ribosomal protein S25,mitochondrial [Paramicrosporidium saccamoebae]
MNRPLSAPGYHPEETTLAETKNTECRPPIQAVFAAIEERAELAQSDNRGHKLPLEDLPKLQRSLKPVLHTATLEEDEFESFVTWQHYHSHTSTAGLSPMEIRLLHAYWSQFGSEREIQRALHGPERLADAGGNSAVKSGLAALALASVKDSLMKTIESCHNENLCMLQLVDFLNSLVNESDDELERGSYLNLLALATKYTEGTEAFIGKLSSSRSEIIEAINGPIHDNCTLPWVDGMKGPDIVRRALGQMQMGKARPLWLDTIQHFPPVTFSQPDYVKRTKRGGVPKPPRIEYKEDAFRQRFFRDHPLETFRPTTLDERATRTDAD